MEDDFSYLETLTLNKIRNLNIEITIYLFIILALFTISLELNIINLLRAIFMSPDFVQAFGNLGAGGIVAGVLYVLIMRLLKKIDEKDNVIKEMHTTTINLMETTIKQNTDATVKQSYSIDKNTVATDKLTSKLDNFIRNGHKNGS